MELIDTHIHLDDPGFDLDREACLQRAFQAGVRTLVNAGASEESNPKAVALARQYPQIYAAVGLHPHEFNQPEKPGWSELRSLLSQEKVVALGEIGLDYHVFSNYPQPDPAAQQAGFRQQLQWAKLFELPVIIHIREALADAFRILRQEGPFPARGVLHCYAGGKEQLEETLAMGFYLGLGATITYPRAEALRAAVQAAPLDRMVLETDAPYLPPQKHRGERNEPAYLVEVAKTVAEVKQLSLEQVAEATTQNAQQLFKISQKPGGPVVYLLQGHLYINLTNRCSAQCRFCPRRSNPRVQNYHLTLEREPTAEEVLRAVGNPRAYKEVVFCGFGEPLLRWPILLQVARTLKAQGARIRVNTNGQAERIHDRPLLELFSGVVDEWSVSLNSAHPEQYQQLMQPTLGAEAYPAARCFIERAKILGFQVTLTAVELPEVEVAALKTLAENLGVRYRGRIQARLGEPEE